MAGSHEPSPIFMGLDHRGYAIRVEYRYTPRVRQFESSVAGRRLAGYMMRDGVNILALLQQISCLTEHYGKIGAAETEEQEPFWNQTWLPAFDAIMIYALIALRKPNLYLEIGSGNSTKFARRAIVDHQLTTQIISVDPEPRAAIDRLCDRVIRCPIEQADIDGLTSLMSPSDLVFIDNSHRSFQNSDVTVCLTELVPALPSQVIYGIHDICLPYDYGPWFIDEFYNEQYLVAMYLLGGGMGDRVIMPSYYLGQHPDFAPLVAGLLEIPSIPPERRGGSSFWLQRS